MEWIFEALREELGYADYLGALERYRIECPHAPNLLEISLFVVDYPFAARLFSSALDVIRRLNVWGTTVILSDGDVVFQPRKIQRSALLEAVEDRVLIYIHKEQELGDVEKRYPAEHYVLVDDKLRILTAAKQIWGTRLTSVFPRQGQYALAPQILAAYPPADITIERIDELLLCDLPSLLGAGDSTSGASIGQSAGTADLSRTQFKG